MYALFRLIFCKSTQWMIQILYLVPFVSGKNHRVAWFSTVGAWSLNAPKSEIAHHFTKFLYTREWTIYAVYGKTNIHGLLAPPKLYLTYTPRADRTRACPSTNPCFPWVKSDFSSQFDWDNFLLLLSSPLSLSVSPLYSSHLCSGQNSLGGREDHISHRALCAEAKEESASSSLSWWCLGHTTAIETLTIWSDQNFFFL